MTSLSLEVQGPGPPYFPSGASNGLGCIDRHDFSIICIFFWIFPSFSV